VEHVKQYKLPGGHEEITGTTVALKKAKITFPAHSTYNSPIWHIGEEDET
jgi:hypothetical protein